MPTEEVAIPQLPAHLAALRSQGYTIVALEQTSASVLMSNFAFPVTAKTSMDSSNLGAGS